MDFSKAKSSEAMFSGAKPETRVKLERAAERLKLIELHELRDLTTLCKILNLKRELVSKYFPEVAQQVSWAYRMAKFKWSIYCSECKTCGRSDVGHKAKGYCVPCYDKSPNGRAVRAGYKRTEEQRQRKILANRARRQKTSKALIESLGGKCVMCGEPLGEWAGGKGQGYNLQPIKNLKGERVLVCREKCLGRMTTYVRRANNGKS